MDREYNGLKINGMSMGEYVFADFFKPGDSQRIDEDMLFALEKKVQEGLDTAYATAVTNNDKRVLTKNDRFALELMGDRQTFLDAVNKHDDDPMAAQRRTGWRRHVAGYCALRDALALDLQYIDVPSENGGKDEIPSAEYRQQADDMLATLDITHKGLTNASINKVVKALDSARDTEHNGKPFGDFGDCSGGQIRLRHLEALYDRVRMINSVDVDAAELSELGTRLEDMVQGLDANYDIQREDADRVKEVVGLNKDLLELLAQWKSAGGLYNEKRATAFSRLFAVRASDFLYVHSKYANFLNAFSNYGNRSSVMLDGNNELLSPEEQVVADLIYECALKAYDLAKSFLPEVKRLDFAAGHFLNDNEIYRSEDVVHESMENACRVSAGDEVVPLRAKLKSPESLFRQQPEENDVLNPIDTHNENITLVKDMLKVYLAYRDRDSLNGVCATVDMALTSYHRLMAPLQSANRNNRGMHRFVSGEDLHILREQGALLKRLAFDIDMLKQGYLKEDRLDEEFESGKGDQPEDSLMEASDINPEALPDIPLPGDIPWGSQIEPEYKESRGKTADALNEDLLDVDCEDDDSVVAGIQRDTPAGPEQVASNDLSINDPLAAKTPDGEERALDNVPTGKPNSPGYV